jgi:hypothetical protein
LYSLRPSLMGVSSLGFTFARTHRSEDLVWLRKELRRAANSGLGFSSASGCSEWRK